MFLCVGTRVCGVLVVFLCVGTCVWVLVVFMCVGTRVIIALAGMICECWEGTLGPPKEQRVLLTTETSLQLRFLMLKWWRLYKLWFYHVSLVRVTFAGLEEFFLQPHISKKQFIRNGKEV